MHFKQRVFSFVSPSHLVRIVNGMHVFNDLLHQLDDSDAVRFSLLYMLEQGFCGKYHCQPVTEELLALLFKLDEFNRYTVT